MDYYSSTIVGNLVYIFIHLYTNGADAHLCIDGKCTLKIFCNNLRYFHVGNITSTWSRSCILVYIAIVSVKVLVEFNHIQNGIMFLNIVHSQTGNGICLAYILKSCGGSISFLLNELRNAKSGKTTM